MSDEQVSQESNTQSSETDQVSESSSQSLIGTATQIAERLEAANKRTEELLQRQEALRVQATLDGSSVAQNPAKKEESPEEYKERVLRGELNE